MFEWDAESYGDSIGDEVPIYDRLQEETSISPSARSSAAIAPAARPMAAPPRALRKVADCASSSGNGRRYSTSIAGTPTASSPRACGFSIRRRAAPTTAEASKNSAPTRNATW